MSLASVSVRRPVLATVMSLIIVLFGLIGYHFLGVREFPSIDPPIISVRANYPGANAQVVESQITEPLERALNGIPGVRNLSSSSNQGSSNITVEFELSADLEAAANDVRDKVNQAVGQLPKDLDGLPTVSKADANAGAIISLTVQSDTRNYLALSDFAENVIGERLQTIPGVSTLQIWGQKRYAIRLWMDPDKLSGLGLTVLDVKNALDRENVELPAGKVAGDLTELTLRTQMRLTDEKAFNDLIIAERGGRNIRFSDVGRAILYTDNEETILRESGVPMVAVALVPLPGANHIDIAKRFYERLAELQKEVPPDIHLGVAMDNTQFVLRSVHEVRETLLIAVALVVFIVFLFFRDWLVAIRPLIDIPVSLIGAFFVMYLMGFSINVLTLLAVVLATGIVVDDGIVVAENIFRKNEEGMAPLLAAEEGTKEIFFAVISTSVTLAAVFLPVIFMPGFVGRLFREFGVVIATAVAISAFVSLTLTPMLSARLIRKNHKRSRFYEMTEPFFVWLSESYRASLSRFAGRPGWVAVILAASSLLIALFFWILPSELAPLEDRNLLRLAVTAPEGASFDYTDAVIRKITGFVEDSVPEKRVMLTVTAPGFSGSGAVNTGMARLVLAPASDRKRSQDDVAGQLNRAFRTMPEARTFATQEQTLSAGGGGRGGLPVQIVLLAPNFEKLREALPRFLAAADSHPVLQGVDVNLKFNKPELFIEVDREKAMALGLSTLDVGRTLQLALSGQRFGYFVMNGKQYSIVGQVERKNRDEPIDLASLTVRNAEGSLVRLDNVVSLREESSPPQRYRYNRYISATVSAGLAPGKTIGDGVEAMEKIAKQTLDDSFSTTLTGPSRDFTESSSNALFAFGLALILVYLILAAQFESFRYPLIVMLTVPLALAGALFSLWYFNQTLNIFSQIGLIMLIGLVTKNGILIVEFTNQLRKRGLAAGEAVVEASVLRLRPILMTTLSTILGALPIALALGAGAKSRAPMGIAVIGGLLFSLVLTLYVIPAAYLWISRERTRPT